MQVTINVPDNLPQAVIQHYVAELEQKLLERAQAKQAGSKWKAMAERIENSNLNLGSQAEAFTQGRNDFRESFAFKDNK